MYTSEAAKKRILESPLWFLEKLQMLRSMLPGL
jgi:hypothetical protein